MTTINLKRYYPYMTENVMLEVSDEIAATLSMGGRLCDSYKRQKRRNGECSLDTDPGFEADVLRQPMTPDEYIEARETTFALYDALTHSPFQAHRKMPYFFLLCGICTPQILFCLMGRRIAVLNPKAGSCKTKASVIFS